MVCCIARALVLVPLLAGPQPRELAAPGLEVDPDSIAPSGGVLRVRVAPQPHAPESVWVGLAFGNLVRLDTSPDPTDPQRRFCAEVPPLAEVLAPSPRTGDLLLVVVYSGNRPLAGPRALPVVGRTAPHSPCPISLPRGDRS